MPYQSTYEGDPVYGETTLRTKKIYLKAGLRIPPGSGISEDHLGSELQFIAHLCGIAMDLLEQRKDAAPILRLQREFIEENMDWVQRFCEDVQQTPAVVAAEALRKERLLRRNPLKRVYPPINFTSLDKLPFDIRSPFIA